MKALSTLPSLIRKAIPAPSDIIVRPTSSFNKAAPLSQQHNYQNPISRNTKLFRDVPIFIDDIKNRDEFCSTPKHKTTGKKGLIIKKAGDTNFTIPKYHKQFTEFTQIVCNTQSINLPDYLYRALTASLIVHHMDGIKEKPPQIFHFDPQNSEEGKLFHLFFAASSHGTEYKTPNDHIKQVPSFAVNFMSAACQHRRPSIPHGDERIFAAILMSISPKNMYYLNREFGQPAPKTFKNLFGLRS